uniref:Uncharacterized protein n=1 Tax=Tanacetum cinerariifolium TaxID=118510 RepID=A0A6L2L941_TANCI|nr:hypothetical protein [Tanacetum cinerariifolium]
MCSTSGYVTQHLRKWIDPKTLRDDRLKMASRREGDFVHAACCKKELELTHCRTKNNPRSTERKEIQWEHGGIKTHQEQRDAGNAEKTWSPKKPSFHVSLLFLNSFDETQVDSRSDSWDQH